MNTRPLVDFSAPRVASPDVIRGLREVDPTAELVYLGNGQWMLGRVRQSGDGYYQCRSKAVKILDNLYSVLSNGAQLTSRGKGKVQMAMLWMQGFKPVAMYRGDPGGHIVEDFRRSLFMLHHTSDDEMFRMMDAPKEKAKEEARADIRDTERARMAYQYAFTRQHAVTRHDDPAVSARKVPAGRTRHKTITPNPKVA